MFNYIFEENLRQNIIRKIFCTFLFCVGALSVTQTAWAQLGPDNILYVNQSVSGGSETGDSWSNAMPELREALQWARFNWDESDGILKIWVAAGTYTPTDDADRDVYFRLNNNIELYGGFNGTEANISERNIQSNPTILSGDIDNNDLPFAPSTNSDNDSGTPSIVDHIIGQNSYRVVQASNALLDGFVITGGLAVDDETFDNLSVTEIEKGAGIKVTNASATLRNLIIRGNWAEERGGGMYIGNTGTYYNIEVSANYAKRGGGIFFSEYAASLINFTIVNNEAEENGGGIDLSSENVEIINSIVWGNSGGNMYRVSNPTISNSIIEGSGGSNGWDSYSFGIDGGNNLDEDPEFLEGDSGNYRIKITSPAIDAGDNTANSTSVDAAGNPRFFGGTSGSDAIDMGAYETQFNEITPSSEQIIYVNKNVVGGNKSGDSWANASPNLYSVFYWIENEWVNPGNPGNELEVWIAEGTYVPTDNSLVRDSSFVLNNKYYVRFYGGFDGTETVRSERDIEVNETILSGDIDKNDLPFAPNQDSDGDPGTPTQTDHIKGANSYHVLKFMRNVETIVMDGISITGGLANGSGDNANGGGVFENSSGLPVFNRVKFYGNRATGKGGAVHSTDASFRNTLIHGNSAAGSGGGIYTSRFFLTLRNSTLTGNYAENGGGAYISTSLSLSNSIVWENAANNSGNEFIVDGSQFTSRNSIYGNGSSDVIYSGTVNRQNSLNIDPEFVDPDDGDYRLSPTSFAINSGENGFLQNSSLFNDNKDLGGNNRIFDDRYDRVDMGAYEYQGTDIIGANENNILYVDANVSEGNETGNSWANAMPDLTNALAWADFLWDADTFGELSIWIADGTYVPSTDGNRSKSFTITGKLDGTKIYGGFAGTESELSERNLASNRTILSGDIGTQSDNSDNSYHVVELDGTGTEGPNGGDITTATLISDVTITKGYADDASEEKNDWGGGLICDGEGNVCSPTLKNIIFTDNYAEDGGAMFNDGTSGNSSPAIINAIFTNNSSLQLGGAVFNYGSEGGTSSPQIINSTFSNNTAGTDGGAIATFTSSSGIGKPEIINSILWGNEAGDSGPEMYNLRAAPTVSYSIVEGGVNGSGVGSNANTDGGNNLQNDPEFTDPENGDFTLQQISPAINTGNNSANNENLDALGNARIYDGFFDPDRIDLGAFELQQNPIGPADENNVLYVDTDAGSSDESGVSWEFALTELSDALDWAANNWDGSNAPLKIWVAEGTYTPDSGSDRNQSFQLTDSVQVYGGFAGTESSLSERDFTTNETILSGDITGNDDTFDPEADSDGDENTPSQTDHLVGPNSYSVVTFNGTDSTAILDGFTVSGGLANEIGDTEEKRQGGGLYGDGGARFNNLIIQGNQATLGGGLSVLGNAEIKNAKIIHNASTVSGGGVFLFNSDELATPVLSNSLIYGNYANNDGGGIYNAGKSTLNNLTVTNNTANNGGGIYNNSSETEITISNSIIWGNTATNRGIEIFNGNYPLTVLYSLYGNGAGDIYTNGGTFKDSSSVTQNPQFTDAANHDYTLQRRSPAINTGDPLTDLSVFVGGASNPIDIAGNARIYDSTLEQDIIDMGAFEMGIEPILSISPSDENIIFVDQTKTAGNQSGTSWTNASPELNKALDWASNDWDGSDAPLQIWVATGTYTPSSSAADQDTSFTVANNVEVYGGFGGTESTPEERDYENNITVLSGDIGNDDEEFDPETDSDENTNTPSSIDHIVGSNSWHIVDISNTDSTAILDGFTIRSGQANGVESNKNGAAIYSDNGNSILRNLVVEGNTSDSLGSIYSSGGSSITDSRITNNVANLGAGIYVSGNSEIQNLTIENNEAAAAGGGIYNTGAPELDRLIVQNNSAMNGGAIFTTGAMRLKSSFIRNNAASENGAGIYNTAGSHIINSLMHDNTAENDGGAFYNSGDLVVTNTTISQNTASDVGGGIHSENGSPQLNNTIIWDNEAVEGKEISIGGGASVTLNNSLFDDSFRSIRDNDELLVTNSSITTLPEFTDPENNDFTLTKGSDAIDAGDNTLFPADITTDLASEKRIREFIDIGAFEYQGVVVTGTSISFDGVDDRIEIPHISAYENLANFTIEMWVEPDITGDRQGLIEKFDNGSSGWWVDIDSDLTATIITNSGTLSLSSATNLPDEEWTHLAITYDGTDLRMYINGVLSAQSNNAAASGAIVDNNKEIVLGNLNWSPAPYEGLMNEVRLWSSTKTAEQIRNNMFQQLSGSEENLISYLPLTTTNSLNTIDASAFKNDGVLKNGVSTIDASFPTGTFITGSEGWSMMSPPFEEVSISNFFDELWTQGYPGSDAENQEPNLYTYNESTGSFEAIDDNQNVFATTGLIIYVFDDQDYDGSADGFPKEIRQDGLPAFNGDISATVSFTDTGNLQENGWNLIGNPYNSTINWDATEGLITKNMDASFYVWNNEAGSYQSWNGASGSLQNGLIAPWQGFWVKANANNPEIAFTDEARSAGGIFQKESPVPELKITIDDGQFSNSAFVMLSDKAKVTKDNLDAYKLESLNANYLSLYTQLENGSALDINALPADLKEPVSVGLDIAGSELDGDANLSWDLSGFPDNWKFILRDNHTGQDINLNVQSNVDIRFSGTASDKQEATKSNSERKAIKSPVHQIIAPKVMSKQKKSRFTLTIYSAQAVTNERLADIPEVVELQQNYPNPFNPTTNIEYGVPEMGEVTMEVFDLLGRKVATLLDRETKQAGRYSVQFDASQLSSGLYLYRLKTGNTVITKKLTLIK